ncbi:MAG: hypothetical protein WDO12_08870 [Pseudomonadota bacterium]
MKLTSIRLLGARILAPSMLAAWWIQQLPKTSRYTLESIATTYLLACALFFPGAFITRHLSRRVHAPTLRTRILIMALVEASLMLLVMLAFDAFDPKYKAGIELRSTLVVAFGGASSYWLYQKLRPVAASEVGSHVA